MDRFSLLWIPFAFVLGGCDLLQSGERSPQYAIETDRDVYEVAPRISNGAAGIETTIPQRFRNVTADTVYLLGCMGPLSPSLQKYSENTWSRVWSYPVRLCGFQVWAEIPPGGVYVDTLRVIAMYPGQSTGPEFTNAVSDSSDVPGRYRLKRRVYTGRDTDSPELPDHQSVSNPFDFVWRTD